MPLRKAKDRETEYKPEKTIDAMIRRVEKLHGDFEKFYETFRDASRNTVFELIQLCHADLCEIAGIEREGEIKMDIAHPVEWEGTFRGTDMDPRETGWCATCRRQIYDGQDDLHRREATKNEA